MTDSRREITMNEFSVVEFAHAHSESELITEMSGNFYREGGFDDVALGEMLFSVLCILGIDIP